MFFHPQSFIRNLNLHHHNNNDQLAAANAAAAEAAAAFAAAREADPLKHLYGDLPLIQSAERTGRKWVKVSELSADADAGKNVLVRARVHAVRGGGKSCFMVLRQRTETIQLVVMADEAGERCSRTMVKYAAALTKESVVDVEAEVSVPEKPVESCSISGFELKCVSIKCVSRAGPLPFDVVDASRSEEEVAAAAAEGKLLATVSQDTRLDGRVVDLRVPTSQAIFTIQSAVCSLFRESLTRRGFTEIHSPCLIAGASEGGAACFALDYMGRPACLAQSPQLYKQMALSADFDRVFEITPVFRAEKSFTHRHLTEFTGLDFEMCIDEHYGEVLDVIDALFVELFDGLNERCRREIEVVRRQFPSEPLRYLRKTLVLEFSQGIKMLKEEGGYPDLDEMEDLNTEVERALGKLVADKYNTDFFILTRYPSKVRPFYTMPDPKDPRYSNSYDVFIRGEEIISGAQRVHDAALLTEQAERCQIPIDGIRDYISSFKWGAFPHGGAGVGLERVVMLFLGLDNIRKTSMFPRDPKRLTP